MRKFITLITAIKHHRVVFAPKEDPSRYSVWSTSYSNADHAVADIPVNGELAPHAFEMNAEHLAALVNAMPEWQPTVCLITLLNSTGKVEALMICAGERLLRRHRRRHKIHRPRRLRHCDSAAAARVRAHARPAGEMTGSAARTTEPQWTETLFRGRYTRAAKTGTQKARKIKNPRRPAVRRIPRKHPDPAPAETHRVNGTCNAGFA